MQKPSLKKMILNDFPAFALATAGVIFLVFALFMAIVPLESRGAANGPLDGCGGVLLSAGISLMALGLLAKRVAHFKKVLLLGPRVPALITDLVFVRDRGRLAFSFRYQGKELAARALVMKNGETRALAVGDMLEAAVDPDNPGKALLAVLYCVHESLS